MKQLLTACSLLIATLNNVYAEDATMALRDKLKAMDSFSANFQQTLYDEADQELQQSQGAAKLKRPGHLYWSTQSPYENLMIADNKTLWRYDIDLEQVTQQPLDKNLSQTPALLLSGEVANIDKNFVVRRTEQGEDQTTFILEPKRADSLLRQLSLTFKADAISSMRIVDDLQQRTDIEFSDVVVNAEIDADVFKFEVPPGVDLLTNE
ncbi:MAG: outer membrane lipoprotein chaperone LolA [Pseudomonadales bacterium]